MWNRNAENQVIHNNTGGRYLVRLTLVSYRCVPESEMAFTNSNGFKHQMKTCITCQHYFKDEFGSEECARTKKVSQKQSPVDGQTRQLTSYTLCKVERLGGTVANLFIALLVGSRPCGKSGRYWAPQSLESIDITEKTTRIFGSADLAKQWLNTVNLAFGGRTPVSLLETPEGKIRLLAVLNAIEQGGVL